MTWVAVVFTPIVLVYQGWTYWVFRRRLDRRARSRSRPRAAPDAGRRRRRPTCVTPLDPRLLRYARTARATCGPSSLGAVAGGADRRAGQLLAERHHRGLPGRRGRGRADADAGLWLAAVVVLRGAAVAWAAGGRRAAASAAVKSRAAAPAARPRRRARAAGSPASAAGELATLATRGLDALDAYFARYLPQLVLAALVPAVVAGPDRCPPTWSPP